MSCINWALTGRSPFAKRLSAITRAGIAHIWFESIHPFEDGNGRIGRAIAEKALAQAIEQPSLTALAETIHRHRKDYYEQLHRASVTNKIDDWLAWFAGIALEAQDRTLTRVRFLIAKTRMLDRLNGSINARQEKALLRMLPRPFHSSGDSCSNVASGLSRLASQTFRCISSDARRGLVATL